MDSSPSPDAASLTEGDAVTGIPLDRVGWQATTARLALRRATPDDAQAVWRYRCMESVARWLTALPRDFEEFRAQFVKPSWLTRTLVVELDDELVGDLMLKIQDGWAQAERADEVRNVEAELGWVFHPDYTRRGLATEAVHELLRICFEDLGLRRVIAQCFALNETSWRLMERVGMRRESYAVRDSLHRSGDWLDGMTYALLKEDWAQRKLAS